MLPCACKSKIIKPYGTNVCRLMQGLVSPSFSPEWLVCMELEWSTEWPRMRDGRECWPSQTQTSVLSQFKIRITRRHYCKQHKAPSRIPAEILSILIPASHLLTLQKMKNQKLQQKLIKIEVRIKVPGPFYWLIGPRKTFRIRITNKYIWIRGAWELIWNHCLLFYPFRF